MAKSVLIICGHKNIEGITAKGLRTWRAWSQLAKSTGASGEKDWVWDKLMPLLRDKLITAGIQVYITDAIYHEETYSRDYDLCVALHFDAGGENSRCMISKPRPDIVPPFITSEASLQSDHFISHWNETYPAKTGIKLRNDAVTVGMTDYYCWDYVGVNTPSVIIEHGNNTCPSDHETMFDRTNLVADGDVEAILKYFQIQSEETDQKFHLVQGGVEIKTYDKNPDDIILELSGKLKTSDDALAGKTLEANELRGELEKQERDNVDLSNQLLKAQSEKNDANRELAVVQGQIEGFQNEIDKLRDRVTILDTTRLELEQKVKDAQYLQASQLSIGILAKAFITKLFHGKTEET